MDISPKVRDQCLSYCRANLADGEAEDFLKIRRLTDEEQVEGPAAAKVGHDDGIHRHGSEEVTPWGFEFLPGIDINERHEWVCYCASSRLQEHTPQLH